MDGVNLIYRLQKQVEEAQKNVQTFLLNGQVDNYEKYQYMVGQLRAYEAILQEISTLLTNKEPEDNETKGTVIDISSKTKT
jgi:CHASE3 domain sensor protein